MKIKWQMTQEITFEICQCIPIIQFYDNNVQMKGVKQEIAHNNILMRNPRYETSRCLTALGGNIRRKVNFFNHKFKE